MEKITVNITGKVFYIEKKAYHSLKNYLQKIKLLLINTKDSESIIYDLKSRIRELLDDKLKTTSNKTVELKMIEEVKSTLGNPEEYCEEEIVIEKEIPKRLYRDVDNKMIGGVCSGLSHYFGTKVNLLRIILLLLALFSWGGLIIIYILLWIFLTGAYSTSQKKAMKGKPINL